MRSEHRAKRALALAALVATLFALAACGTAMEEAAIPPVPADGSGADLGLGPGARPLTFGPGDKGSPSWSPSGERIAFTIDGYVVDKDLLSRDTRRWTTKDFGAGTVEWTSDTSLAILGTNLSSAPAEDDAPRSIYRTRPDNGPLSVTKVVSDALAMAPLPGRGDLVAALETSRSRSGLVRVRVDGQVSRVHPDLVEGDITGISISPDRQTAVLVVRTGETGPYELYTYRFPERRLHRVARLEEGMEVLGAAQWTAYGIYYVAGERGDPGSESTSRHLYRVSPDSGRPEIAPGVGEGFVAASLRVSPEGGRLALIGRRNPSSSTNLYVLDLSPESMRSITSNDNMQIKTGPDDLAWSEDGRRVTIVARGALTEPRVRPAPADTLLADFYNLYEVPVGEDTIPEEVR
jgi:Tol biopolymer transport system component